MSRDLDPSRRIPISPVISRLRFDESVRESHEGLNDLIAELRRDRCEATMERLASGIRLGCDAPAPSTPASTSAAPSLVVPRQLNGDDDDPIAAAFALIDEVEALAGDRTAAPTAPSSSIQARTIKQLLGFGDCRLAISKHLATVWHCCESPVWR